MTTNLAVQTCALTSGWLDEKPPTTSNFTNVRATSINGVALNQATTITNRVAYGWQNYWPNGTYWYYCPTQDHKPIKLGMSEVEKLRSAAKRDAKLKKILEKFTDQIEVVVDFK